MLIAVIAIVVVAILLLASTRPSTFHVERSINIQARPEAIFPFVNDLRSWDAWTPYDKDPAMKKVYSGSATGKGASFAWDGNKQAGKGEITIADSSPPNRLVFDLHMIRPFEGRNVATINLDPIGDATNVTWSLDDQHNLLLKIMTLFLNLDRAIGKDFELGLSRLKATVERSRVKVA